MLLIKLMSQIEHANYALYSFPKMYHITFYSCYSSRGLTKLSVQIKVNFL